MILLDTNVIYELMKSKPDTSVLAWVDLQIETDLYICAITKAEVEWGVGVLPDGKRKKQLQQASNAIFEMFAGRCLEYNCSAASNYVTIGLEAKLLGRPMSSEDMMIAAIAQSQNGLLATRNVKDFDFLSDVQLFNPW